MVNVFKHVYGIRGIDMDTKQNTILKEFKKNSNILQALGDPVRQEIILIIGGEELNVQEITDLSDVSRPAISHHLKILKEAGIVKMKKHGKKNVYSLHAKESLRSLKKLIEYVENQCE